jgi:hypothetical protein
MFLEPNKVMKVHSETNLDVFFRVCNVFAWKVIDQNFEVRPLMPKASRFLTIGCESANWLLHDTLLNVGT